MSLRNGALCLLIPVYLLGCSKGAGGGKPAQAPQVAIVNGQPISQALLDAYSRAQTGADFAHLDANSRQVQLENLKRLAAAAGEEAPNADAALLSSIDLARMDILARGGAQVAGVYVPPTDAELQAAYQTFVASLPKHEYHAAHVLVATEEQAREVLRQLAAGADFASVAKKESQDTSKATGGDIGWIYAGNLPPAFLDALGTLSPGEFARVPVQTPYGWHVIRLLETRSPVPPAFDDVKAQLAANIIAQRYQKFLDAALSRSNSSSAQ